MALLATPLAGSRCGVAFRRRLIVSRGANRANWRGVLCDDESFERDEQYERNAFKSAFAPCFGHFSNVALFRSGSSPLTSAAFVVGICSAAVEGG